MIVLGKLLKATGFADYEKFKAAMQKTLPVSKRELLKINLKAVELGYSY
jgi:Pyruvate/2-oxoacid:ferredoxin oxidoreductase gamma subunit